MGEQTAKTTTAKGEYRKLLDDKDVKRWYDNLKASSQITAKTKLNNLWRFCKETKQTPRDIIEKDTLELTDQMSDFIEEMLAEDYAP